MRRVYAKWAVSMIFSPHCLVVNMRFNMRLKANEVEPRRHIPFLLQDTMVIMQKTKGVIPTKQGRVYWNIA